MEVGRGGKPFLNMLAELEIIKIKLDSIIKRLEDKNHKGLAAQAQNLLGLISFELQAKNLLAKSENQLTNREL